MKSRFLLRRNDGAAAFVGRPWPIPHIVVTMSYEKALYPRYWILDVAMNKKLPAGLAITILAAGLALIGLTEWRALYTADHPAPRRIDAAYCASCHAGAASLKALKHKEGNTHFLFQGPATPASATTARVC